MPSKERVAADRGYRRRQPELTPLYEIIGTHLASFRDHVRDEYERGLPRYVEEEFEQYLRCGILAHGFLRARCRDCGRDLLVAFSCKKRGACPSCNARRMAGTAAHLVDHVVPEVPLRQYVLSVPFELRLLLAKNPAALTMVGRVFVEEVFRWQKGSVREQGVEGELRSAAICFPQRFGSSLNLNVHYHVPVVDGVFTRASPAARAQFHRAPRPKADDLGEIAVRVERRVVRWLRRRGLLGDEPSDDISNVPRYRSPLEACLEASLGLGELTTLPGAPCVDDCEVVIAGVPVPRSHHRGGHVRGFDVHAAVVVSPHDRDGRERLLRYCARPPFALERMSLLPDGRIAYALKNPWRSGETHRVMEPVQFLARLAALVPTTPSDYTWSDTCHRGSDDHNADSCSVRAQAGARAGAAGAALVEAHGHRAGARGLEHRGSHRLDRSGATVGDAERARAGSQALRARARRLVVGGRDGAGRETWPRVIAAINVAAS